MCISIAIPVSEAGWEEAHVVFAFPTATSDLRRLFVNVVS